MFIVDKELIDENLMGIYSVGKGSNADKRPLMVKLE